MQETFSLHFDVSYGEYASSLFRYYLKNKLLRYYLFFLLFLTLLSIILSVATSSEMDIGTSLLSSLMSSLAISLFAAILFLLFTTVIYSTNRQVFKDISLEVNHWGVVRNSDKVDLSKPWREIPKAEETKTAFHIYIRKNDFIIIPKRSFKDDTEMNSFGYFLSNKTAFKL